MSELKTPQEMRIELAQSQRMAKTKEKWAGFAEQVNSLECWNKKTSHEGVKIGDRFGFVRQTRRGSCIQFSQCYGTAFAFGEKTMLVVYRGKLEKVELQESVDDVRDAI